jgi:hypothetical protein
MSDSASHSSVDMVLGTPPALVVFTHYFGIVPLQSWVYILTIIYTFLAILRIILNLISKIPKKPREPFV